MKLGLSKEKIEYLYQIIEMLMPLPQEEEEYRMEMAKLKNTEEIKLVSVFEKRMVAKGFEKGQVETLKKLILLKFSLLTPEVEAKLETASQAELERITEKILVANSLEELFSS